MDRLECDVLVVGCGAAGLTAALAAIEAGASVIVLEGSGVEDRGGNTRWTEALLRLRARPENNGPFEVTADFVEGYAAQHGYHVEPGYVAESSRPYEEWTPILRTLPYLDPEVLDAFVTGICNDARAAFCGAAEPFRVPARKRIERWIATISLTDRRLPARRRAISRTGPRRLAIS